MATPTPAARKSLEAKALKEESKSAGMRLLFDAGYTAVEVKEVFGAPYGFVYGVGVRNGSIEATPREEKAAAPKAKAAKSAAKLPAAKAMPAKAAAKPAPRAAKAPAVKPAGTRLVKATK